MKAVIFAGGVGSRLWPLSRENSPKQFESISNNQSTLQMAVSRLEGVVESKDIYVSTNIKFKDTVSKQLPQIPSENLIFEPSRQDVGPAVGLAISILSKKFPSESVAILWGDHLITSEQQFRDMLHAGDEFCQKNDALVFLGHSPRYANGNIGWITYGNLTSTVANLPVYEFERLEYRPSQDKVDLFAKDGKHAWNMGYFVAKVEKFCEFYQKYSPELWSQISSITNSYGAEDYLEKLSSIYPTLPKISLDHAILEKMTGEKSYVISADIGWSDVGSWEALKESLEKNSEDNVTIGNVDLQGSQNSLVYSTTANKLVVGIDIDDLVVVDTDDVLFVAKKSSANKVKKLVESFKGSDKDRFV